MNSIARLLARLPRLLLGATLAAVSLVEAFLLLMTYLVLHDLLATGADAEEKRGWNNLTWDLGAGMIALAAIGALLVFILGKAYLDQRPRARLGADGGIVAKG